MVSVAKIYPSYGSYILNTILFPFKMIVPQPIIEKIPGLMSNYDIRTKLVQQQTKGKLLDIGCAF